MKAVENCVGACNCVVSCGALDYVFSLVSR